MANNAKKIILGVTGSIAAYKACEILRRLMDQGMEVCVVMTESAREFITPVTFAALSGNKVFTSMFDEGEYISHIALGQEADLLLIAPATANIIGKIANGIADDLLTCTVLATKAPVMIAPAMNTNMYENKIVQENCAELKKRGFLFVEPIDGKLACGKQGKGHLADIDIIVQAVKDVLLKH
jgi:phosphopantothenoylcysteine decarboxylase/phosphopantothenate--cysteine ligase